MATCAPGSAVVGTGNLLVRLFELPPWLVATALVSCSQCSGRGTSCYCSPLPVEKVSVFTVVRCRGRESEIYTVRM